MTTIEAKHVEILRWVAQEAKALKLLGVPLPQGSRLREALAALDAFYSEGGSYVPPEMRQDKHR